MELIETVETYYATKGILSTAFTCESRSACERSGTESGPKSAFVGSRYGRCSLPRLLFVSLDAGEKTEDEQRTPDFVRDDLEKKGVTCAPRNRHWYRTHEIACAILGQFDKSLRPAVITPYFAHTNASKCCNPKAGKASRLAYLNCHRYLAGEIRVLDPDIIVTQGQEAQIGVDALVGEVENQVDKYGAEVGLLGRARFLLHTHHPHYAKGFYAQMRCSDGWHKYAKAIHDFCRELSGAQ